MLFRYGHVTHPDWRLATELCLAQVEGQAEMDEYGRRGNLGFVYLTEPFGGFASEILTLLKIRTGIPNWVGTVGMGIIATGVEYYDEPAMAIMLGDFPQGSFQVFSGVDRPPTLDARTPTGAGAAHAALVHADPHMSDLDELLEELAAKVRSGQLFGGLTGSRSNGEPVQIANRCLSGGLSGVVFAEDVARLTRVSQGCHPIGPMRLVTQADRNVIVELAGRPALDVLIEDARADTSEPWREMFAHLARHTLCGFFPPRGPTDWDEAQVRHMIGLDPRRGALAVAHAAHAGMRLRFCMRDLQGAREDLEQMCRTMRAEIEAAHRVPCGGLYFSCVGRGRQLFDAPASELEIVRAELGDVPLVGFFANGEIAGQQMYTYTGVLTLFTAPT